MLTIPHIIAHLTEQGHTDKEAAQIINDAIEQLRIYMDDNDLDSAYNICQEFFGLEPDYLPVLIEFI
jgi:hypothetical protein